MEFIDNKIKEIDASKIESLNSNDYLKLKCNRSYYGGFIKIDDKIYKVKYGNITFLREFIGEAISKYFNLQTVDNFLVRCGGITLLLNELFTNAKDDYGSIDRFPLVKKDVFLGLDNLNNLTEYSSRKVFDIIKISKDSHKKLLEDIKKMVVCDFVTGQVDRCKSNFMFRFDGDNVVLMPLYDHEMSFYKNIEACKYNGYFNMNFQNQRVIEYINNDEYLKMLLNKVLEMDMKEILKSLEEKGIGISNEEMEYYIDSVEERKRKIMNSKILI